jgi:hypothetical protein
MSKARAGFLGALEGCGALSARLSDWMTLIRANELHLIDAGSIMRRQFCRIDAALRCGIRYRDDHRAEQLGEDTKQPRDR